MCQPQNPVVKGQTWAPRTAMTDAQMGQRAQELFAKQPTIDAVSGSGIDDGARMAAARSAAFGEQQQSIKTAADDQYTLATWDQQQAKTVSNPNEGATVTANKRRNAAGTLTTGGVNMGGAAPTGRTSLLGG